MNKSHIQKILIVQRQIEEEYNRMTNSSLYQDLLNDINDLSQRYNGFNQKTIDIELQLLQFKKNECMQKFYDLYKVGLKLMGKVPNIKTLQDENVIKSFSHFMQTLKLL